MGTKIDAVCVYCGSSDAAPKPWLGAAAMLGASLANQGLKLVYGGGGVGLMGACARAAHDAGGRVLGVIPDFLTKVERPPLGVETEVVPTMHARKMRMFEAADAFAVLPGAIGTLEEAIELLSWRRLGLHDKPIVFYNPAGFWDPLLAQFDRFMLERLAPAQFAVLWSVVEDIDDIIPALRAAPGGPALSLKIEAVT